MTGTGFPRAWVFRSNAFVCLFFVLFCFFPLHIFICLYFLVDVCKNYQPLTDGTRKYDYITANPEKCDDTLKLGWYRFQEAAGTKMVTKCPPKNSCDADFPVWLSEQHPTVAEGAVQRKFCIRQLEDCCKIQFSIKVKNCSSYYIYRLQDPDICNARYCSID